MKNKIKINNITLYYSRKPSSRFVKALSKLFFPPDRELVIEYSPAPTILEQYKPRNPRSRGGARIGSKIWINSNYDLPEFITGKDNAIEHLGHEIGHIIYEWLPEEDLQELAFLYKLKDYPSSYGGANLKEYWAESFRRFLRGDEEWQWIGKYLKCKLK